MRSTVVVTLKNLTNRSHRLPTRTVKGHEAGYYPTNKRQDGT